MKRKMIYIGISYGVGLFFASFFHSIHLSIILIATITVLGILKFLCKFNLKEIIVCVTSFIIGLSIYTIYNNTVYKQILSYADGNVYNIEGKITEITDYNADKSQYKINATINGISNIRLIFYGDTTDCKYGDNISLTATLEQPKNTYKFSAEEYYRSKNIFLEVGEVNHIKITSNSRFSLTRSLLAYRSKISNRICEILPNQEGKIIVGMLFGEKTSLDDSISTAFYRTGIGHIMSVSGLHLVILAGLVEIALKKLKSTKYVTFISVEIMILVFCICSGMAISVIRSAIMLTLIYSAELFQRRPDTLNSLCIAVILLTIGSPFTINDPSFLLSVAGVYGIGVLAPYISSDIKKIKAKKLLRNVIAMFCVALVVLPVSMRYFDETSIVSPIANLLLIPLCEIALICGIIVFFTGGISFIAYPVLSLGGLCCKVVTIIVKWIAKIPYTHMPLDYTFFQVTAVMLVIFSLLTFALFRQSRYVRISLMLWIPVFMFTSICYTAINKDILKIAILGKDKNSVSIVISKDGNNDIIDLTGNNKAVDYVSKYITSCGINRVGTLAITKKPYALMTSYNSAFENLKVRNVMLPIETYMLDGSEICGVKPNFSAFYDTEIKYNNYSIKFVKNGAVVIKYGKFEFLCINDKSQLESSSPTVVMNYGKYSGESFECGYLIILDKIASINSEKIISGENNIHITCDKKGNVKVEEMKN